MRGQGSEVRDTPFFTEPFTHPVKLTRITDAFRTDLHYSQRFPFPRIALENKPFQSVFMVSD